MMYSKGLRFARYMLLLMVMVLPAGSQEKGNQLQFSWAFVGATPEKKGWTIFPITKDTLLKAGDNLMVYVDPQSDCYMYLFLHDSEEKVHLLFPSSAKEFGAPIKKTERYLIPQKGSGFELDESGGKETFYFLVSASRLTNVEDAFTHMASGKQEAGKDYTKAFLAELRNVFKSSAKSFSSFADISPSIAGAVRGKDLQSTLKDIDFNRYATEITEKNLFVKKIVIRHR